MNYLSLKPSTLPQAVNAGLFISPGYGIHPRRTIDSFEMIMIRKGSLTMAEQYHTFQLNRGDALILCPDREHWGLSHYDDQTSFYWIHFFLDAPSVKLHRRLPRTSSSLVLAQCTRAVQYERMTELLRRFLHRQEVGFFCPMEADLLVAQMLVELAACRDQSQHTAAVRSVAARARQLIEQDYRQPALSPGLIAQHLDLNPDYLGRVFRQVYRTTMGEYLNQRRLREVRRLLLETQLTINQIALQAGYHDPAYCQRLFKRAYDMTASQWRRMHTQMHINIE